MPRVIMEYIFVQFHIYYFSLIYLLIGMYIPDISFTIDYLSTALWLSALGIYFHAISITIVMGISPLIAILEFIGLYKNNDLLFRLAKKLSIVVVVAFGFGAATGTLVEFGLIQVWNTSLLIIASFAFAPLFFELVAFTLEAGLAIALVYTWGRFRNPWMHWLITVSYAFGALLSGALITSVNSWIQVPWGVGDLVNKIYPWAPIYGPQVVDAQALLEIKRAALRITEAGGVFSSYINPDVLSKFFGEGRRLLYDPWITFSSPYTIVSIYHQLLATFIAGTAWVLAGLAYKILRGDEEYIGPFKLVASISALSLMIQGLVGHEMGVNVYKYQPTKFALLAGLISSGPDPFAGLTMFGDPNYVFDGFDRLIEEAARGGMVINGVNIALRDTMAAMTNISIIYPMYMTKISLAVISGLIGIFYLICFIKKDFLRGRESIQFILAYPYAFMLTLVPILGWAVREIGRKPWTIYGLFYPEEVITPIPISHYVAATIIGGILVGIVLMIYTIYRVLVKPPSFLESG